MANQIKAWSFSRWSVYQLCPQKAKFMFIDKIKEPGNAAMQRGIEIHTLAERYIKSELPKLPAELQQFAGLFHRLKRRYKRMVRKMAVEETWAFTRDWDETTWDDWAHCWVRIKLDCAEYQNAETLIINDWKTGKYRPEKNQEYVEQMELYALAALMLYPHITAVKPRLVYLDLGTIYPPQDNELVYTQRDVPRLKKLWEARVQPMLSDKVFAPRPNNLCHWCHYRKGNKANGGGQCQY